VLIFAILLRSLLDPFLGDISPLVTIYAAVAIAVWVAGAIAAASVMVLGYAACHVLFMPPRGGFDFTSGRISTALAAFSVTCVLIITIGEAMRRAQRRAAERSNELRDALAERQKLVALVENSTDFIAMCDTAFVPLYVNPAGLKMVGLTSVDEARALRVHDFFLPEDQPRIMQELFAGVAQNGCGEAEVRFRHFRGGEPRWMAYKVITLRDATGAPVAYGTVSQDISERRRMEQSLRELAASLSDADRRKNVFLATLAHELRTPLAPLANSLELVKRSSGESATLGRALGVMDRQVAHIVRLVDDLLDLSRIAHDRLELRREPLELAAVIAQAVEACRPFARRAGHQLDVRVPEEPLHLHADRARLTQVFANLLHNACKYTPPRGTIVITAARDERDAVVTVQDNGIGIPADRLERIFDMFEQIDCSLERSQGGLGIGLTLVRRLVQMHGGMAQAHSDGEKRGSRFIVRLPLAAPMQRSSAPVAEEASVPSRRVLVVDDNRDAADSLAALLRLTGQVVQTAYDGGEALEAAKSFRPELVLLDIGLPVLNGLEVCRRLREERWGAGMIVIALTGWGQENDRNNSREAGFNAHLVKPVSYPALAELLRNA
jgi:PAS domain S-box-containing protein